MSVASHPNLLMNAAPASPAAYTNGVNIVASQWDITILFFHSAPALQSDAGGEQPMEQRLVQGVVMSPQHAKALVLVLDKNVKAWEDQNSEIELPEEVVRGLTGNGPGSSQGGP